MIEWKQTLVCHSETGFVWNVIPLDVPLSSRPLVSLGVSHRHEILYNLGIQLLFSGRPLVAFDCLVEAVQIYHTNPRLWLRLAECTHNFKKEDQRHVFVCPISVYYNRLKTS